MTSKDIQNVQSMLNDLGDDLEVDGQIGPKTKEAIKQFQLNNNLLPTGLVDADLINKLTVVSKETTTSEDAESFFSKYQNQIIVGSVVLFFGGVWFVKNKLLSSKRIS